MQSTITTTPESSPTSFTQPVVEPTTTLLFYRAQTYKYTPRPPRQLCCKPCALNHTVKDGAVKLLYRGQAYEYTPAPIQPYRKPRAMNWRFQMAAKG